MVESVLGFPELAGINQALGDLWPLGAGVSFLLCGLRQLTPTRPMQDFFPSPISSRSARGTGGRGRGRQGLSPLCFAGCYSGLLQPFPLRHGVSLGGWALGVLECLPWTVFSLIIPPVQPFETILLCSEPRPSMGVSSYEVFGTIFSLCFLFLNFVMG